MIRYLVILLVIVLALAWASIASAAVQLDGQGCMEYAIWSRDLVWARDVGADREKVRASLAEMRVELARLAGVDIGDQQGLVNSILVIGGVVLAIYGRLVAKTRFDQTRM